MHYALYIQIGIHANRVGEGEGLRLEVLIDIALNLFQALAGIGKPLFDAGFLDLHKRNAGVRGARGNAELLQFVGCARMVGAIGHQNHAGSTVDLGVGGLGGKLRVLGKGLAFKDALGVRLLRLVAQHQYDLAFDVEARIVVVVVFRRGDAVAHKDHGARQRSGLRKIERDKLVGEVQRGTVAFRGELEAVRLAQRGVGGYRKGLQIALAGGSDVQLTVMALQERGCLF